MNNEVMNKLKPYKEYLEITDEDIELLKEMKKNCLKSDIYEDEKRLLKANAITKLLVFYEENKQLQQKVNQLELEVHKLRHYRLIHHTHYGKTPNQVFFDELTKGSDNNDIKKMEL